MIFFPVICAIAPLIVLLSPVSAAAVPAEKPVLSPFGERLPSNVHLVPSGGEVRHVGSEVHLVDAAGKVLHVAQNTGAKIRAPSPSATSSGIEPLQTGWVAYADWYNTLSSPISSFKTTWDVPKEPGTKTDGQTIFLFNSIEPASGDAILQPVLQWGPSAAGGGTYWAVATWYLVGSDVYHTTPVKVSVGKELHGRILLKSSSGSKYNYQAEFTNIDDTSLKATGSAELVWATETLEVYGMKKKSDYPDSKTVFEDIALETKSDSSPSVKWSAVSDNDDGVTATINTQGSKSAKVTINY